MHQSTKAKKHIILNHKFINDSLNWKYNEFTPMEINSKGKKTEIKYHLSRSINDMSDRFNTFDKRVYNAVVSLYEAGNDILTPSMIYRHMNGMDKSRLVSDTSIKNIHTSMNKCINTQLGIVFSDDAQYYKGSEISVDRLQGRLIDAEPVNVITGGYETLGYQVNEQPILFQYVRLYSRHIITVDAALLNVKDEIKRESMNTMLLKEYLIRRIEIIKESKGRASNKILFQTIYEELQIETPTRKEIEQVRVITEKILHSLIKKKLFKRYELYRSGRAFKGIEIIY